jgi:sulfur carrier protein
VFPMVRPSNEVFARAALEPGRTVDTISQPYGKMPRSMRIVLNGESRDVAEACSIASLLVDLKIRSTQVAVEVNLHIVERGAFGDTALRDGDRVEVIGFIGGGGGDKESVRGTRCFRCKGSMTPRVGGCKEIAV